ncbi:hypothetical protein Hmuk_1902 [Halomicrobium mukohataei DSM 12286]|uniref:Uncharacterized protein n=2 Tax=Halomicrobium mukohataei TaxID=57705 RepID=C7P4J3_HALMD|nr:hypothetical protein Hmuk_1902 [Halomicrobium mukohataei DSM 12286]
MSMTAWNTPQKQIRRQFMLLTFSFLLAVPLFGFYLNWSTIPYRYELGLSPFVAHEFSKIVLLGPTIGLAFFILPLLVLARRIYIR